MRLKLAAPDLEGRIRVCASYSVAPQLKRTSLGAPVTHLFTFESGPFDPASERKNSINPIAGEGLLKWLSAQLDRQEFSVTEPDAEDWGWYVDVVGGQRRYLLGASGDWGERGTRSYWTIQLHLKRSLWDRLSGSNKLAPNDALSIAIEAAVKRNPEFTKVAVDRGA